MSKKNKFRLVIGLSFLLILTLLSITFISAFNRSFYIVNATPRGVLNKKPKEITIIFSKALIELRSVQEMQINNVSKFIKISPSLKGKLQYKSRNSLVYRIDESDLIPNTKYTVTIKAGIKPLKGTPLLEEKKFSFVNDAFRFIGSNFYKNKTHVKLKPKIKLYFNHPLNISAANKYVKLIENYNRIISVKIKKADKFQQKMRYIRGRYISYRYYRYLRYRRRKKIFVYNLITPKLKRNTKYILMINRSVKTIIGNYHLHNPSKLTFKTFPVMELKRPENRIISIRPTNTMSFKFSNNIKIKKKKLLKFINVRDENGKKVKLRYLYKYGTSRYFRIGYYFKPKKTYTLTIKKGIEDIYGQKSFNSYVFTINVKNYYPKIHIPYPSNAIIESYGKINKFPISYLNLKRLVIKINAYHSAKDILNNKPSLRRTINLTKYTVKKNKYLAKYVNLKRYLKRRYGLLDINVYAEKDYLKKYYKYSNDYRLQFTNLSLTVKYSPKNILVFVTNLKTTKPVRNALVSLSFKKGKYYSKILHRARTNRYGYIKISERSRIFKKLYRRQSYRNRLVMFAKKGRDVCMLESKYNNKVSLYNTGAGHTRSYMNRHYGFVFTPKGLYKKNEKVVIKGYIRKNAGGNLYPLKRKRIRIRCTSPNGKKIINKSIITSDYGSFNISYKLGGNPALGRYSIYISTKKDYNNYSYRTSMIHGSFMVEAYRPREFEVNTTFGNRNKIYINKNNVKFSVKGNYLFGGIMKNAALKYRIDAYPYYFKPSKQHLKKYTFSSGFFIEPGNNAQFMSQSSRKRVLYITNKKLGENGVFYKKVKCEVPFYTSANFKLNAEVEDKNRQSVVSTSSVIVHKGNYYIGYKIKNSFISTRERLNLSLLSLTPRQRSAGRKKVKINIYRIEWHNVRQLTSGGTYTWNNEKKYVLVKTLTTYTNRSLRRIKNLKIRIKKPGSYIVTFQSKDRAGNKITNSGHFWAWGGGYTPWRMNNDQTVELVKNKERYKVGEYAKILVKSPYKKIPVLVTIEREGVISSFRTMLKGTADIIKIPIRKSYAPNVFVSVILMQGRLSNKFPMDKLKDIYKPTIKIGYTVLYVDKSHKQLNVKIKSNKNRYEPGDFARLRFRVTGKNGRGVKTECAVFVVDEGVLSLINYKTPNPFLAFYKNRNLMVRTYESRLEVMGQHKYKLKGEDPGGSAEMARQRSSLGLSNVSVRKIFKAIAYSNTSVITSRNGYARVNFKLPDNLTKFRIMVIAVDKRDRFGSGQKHIRVSKNLIARPALPRFINFKDSMNAGVIIDNNTEYKGSIRVYVKTHGIKLKGRNFKRLILSAHASKEIKFNFKANKIGTATFEFIAIMYSRRKKYTDIVRWKIPVKMPYMTYAVAHHDTTTAPTRSEIVRVPQNAYKNTAGLEVTAASTAFINLRGSVEYLFKYPYGCLEQKMSKVIPMLLAGDLVKAFKLNVKINYRKAIQKFLNEMFMYQDASTGAFYYWPEKKYHYRPNPYLSTYAVLVMMMANKKGYKVDRKVYRRGVKFLKNYLSRRNIVLTSYPYRNGYWRSTDILTFYVLSEIDQADESYIEKLYKQSLDCPLYIRSVMVKGLYNVNPSKYKEMYINLMDNISRNLQYEGNYAYFKEDGSNYPYYNSLYLSNVKSTAAVLQMLIKVQKNNPLIPKIVRGIMRRMKNGRWRNTQENMYVFWALSDYLKTFERAVPNFTVNVTAQVKNLLKTTFKGRTFKVAKTFTKFNSISTSRKIHKIKILKRGRGRLYYTLRIKYAPKKISRPVNRGFRVIKRIYDADGKLVRNNAYKAGKVYKVVLVINTNADRQNVVVDDPLPAGFEALNPRLNRSSIRVNTRRRTGYRSNNFWWWRGFNRVSMKDDRVLLFANNLREGKHMYTYFMKATTYGNFIMYPTKAEEMYAPEIFGTSRLKRIRITD